MGLREVKKARARRSIIENAISLFRERGFESTPVRDVAQAAEVSEATFFNYFATKDAVLSAWAHGLVAEAFDTAEGLGAPEQRGVRPLLRGVCDHLAERVEDDRDFAARAWERMRLHLGGAPSEVVSLLETGQQSGQLRRDLSARQLGDILYISICGTVASWLGRAAPAGSLGGELRRGADLVLDGARRRNERVRPGAGAALSTR